MNFEAKLFTLRATDPIRQAILLIDKNERGIAFVVDDEERLIGTVVDGDFRRAMLAGATLDTHVSEVLALKIGSAYETPISARAGAERAELVRLMRERKVRQIPLLDASDRVVDLVTLDELLQADQLPVQAVIMAGGEGKRLRPLTEGLPKPMLPVGEKPLLAHIISQLRESGIERASITTNYLAEKISNYFRDGREHGVALSYVAEDRPLGTAGALSLLKPGDTPLLVINGDILTRVDYRAFLAFHQEHKADLTMGVRRYEFQVPFGVVRTDGSAVKDLVEKPTHSMFVNAGIYLIEPHVQASIPKGERMDMTDLIAKLMKEGKTVAAFPIWEYWLDVGRPADYTRANEDLVSGKVSQ